MKDPVSEDKLQSDYRNPVMLLDFHVNTNVHFNLYTYRCVHIYLTKGHINVSDSFNNTLLSYV